MLTKTKGLLMQKLQQHRSGDICPQPSPAKQGTRSVKEPIKLSKRHPIHISHVNQYNLISVVNKKPESTHCRAQVKQLEIQNLKLTEEKMRLMQWIHNVMKNVREGIMKAIQSIQEFKYLEGVNLLHNFIEQMKEFVDKDVHEVKSAGLSEDNSLFRGYVNPESKHTLLFDLKKLEIAPLVHRFTFFPPKKEQAQKQQYPFIVSHEKSSTQSRKQKQSSNPQLRMLMVQSLALQDMLDRVKYQRILR